MQLESLTLLVGSSYYHHALQHSSPFLALIISTFSRHSLEPHHSFKLSLLWLLVGLTLVALYHYPKRASSECGMSALCVIVFSF